LKILKYLGVGLSIQNTCVVKHNKDPKSIKKHHKIDKFASLMKNSREKLSRS